MSNLIHLFTISYASNIINHLHYVILLKNNMSNLIHIFTISYASNITNHLHYVILIDNIFYIIFSTKSITILQCLCNISELVRVVWEIKGDSMSNKVRCFVNYLFKWGKERIIDVTNQIKIVLKKLDGLNKQS